MDAKVNLSAPEKAKLSVQNLSFKYGNFLALNIAARVLFRNKH